MPCPNCGYVRPKRKLISNKQHTCLLCKKVFTSKLKSNVKFCSHVCRQTHYYNNKKLKQ